MSQPFLREVTADNRDIQRIITQKLAPALDQEDSKTSVLALLAFAVLIQKPNIDTAELMAAVRSTSEHLIMMITVVPAGQAN